MMTCIYKVLQMFYSWNREQKKTSSLSHLTQHYPPPVFSPRRKTYVIRLLYRPAYRYLILLHPAVSYARKKGIPVSSDIHLFFQANPLGYFIGISGTNGKSSAVDLIAFVLNQSGFPATSCGNIGRPILEIVPPKKSDITVIELSSYQLDLKPHLPLHFSALLPITCDHAERYAHTQDYVMSKKFYGMHVCIWKYRLYKNTAAKNTALLPLRTKHFFHRRLTKEMG